MKTLRKALAAIMIITLFVSAFMVKAAAEEKVEDKQPQIYTVTQSDAGYHACGEEYSNISALLEAVPNGGTVYFDNIITSENVILNSDIIISGKIRLTHGSLISEGNSIISDSAEIILERGSVRVKCGSFTFIDSYLCAYGECGVILDYNAGAVFSLVSGEIRQRSESAAILITQGSVYLSGGSVISEYSEAVTCHGTLVLGDSCLDGYGYDIITDVPIRLDGRANASELNVKHEGLFEKGTLTPVFLSSGEEIKSSIFLFDERGEQYSLSFFEKCDATEEKNFLGVYLPYRVRFYSDGALYFEKELLSHEKLFAPDAPLRDGYKFSGWYIDEERLSQFGFGSSVSDDFSLYAAFTLTEPSFHISSLSFTYDGMERHLAFDMLSHPLKESGSFSFDWYKDGQPTKISAAELSIKDVCDSGSYFCVITFAFGGDFVSVRTPEISVSVSKSEVEVPTVADMIYNGSERVPQINKSASYTYTFTQGINVGAYSVTFTLTDAYNYTWSSSESPSVTVYYSITRAENAFLKEPSLFSQCYEGIRYLPSASSLFGEVEFLYSSSVNGPWSCEKPLKAGEYYFKAIVAPCENYTALESEPYRYSVISEVCTGIRIEAPPTKTVYAAFEHVNLDGARFSATYNSGRVEALPLSVLRINYKNGKHLLVSDTAFSVVYEGVSVPISVTVTRARYDLSDIEISDLSVTYDGTRHTAAVRCDIVGLDGIALGFNVSGGGIDAGSYTVTLSFSSESPNYYCPDSISATLTVLPAPLTVNYSFTEFVYDGSAKIPTAEAVLVSGLKLNIPMSGAVSDAGEYTATAVFDNKNYYLINPTVAFTVKKADIPLDGIVWSEGEFVYDGTEKRVFISGLPQNVSVAGYVDAAAATAGEYEAVASLVYDERNYNPPPRLSYKWQISRAEYNMSSVSFVDSEFYFDGNIHYPKLVGVLPVGADGTSPTFAFSSGAIHVSEGLVTVTVTFISQSQNYLSPPKVEATVRIIPKPVSVIWENTQFVFDGLLHLPNAYCADVEIELQGAASDAGEYKATAIPLSSDFEIVNPNMSFKINKSENRWILTPSILSVYTSGTLSPSGEAWYGEVIYEYYLDKEMRERVEIPSLAGTYYMSAYVPESNNCFALRSEPISFEIVAVVPESINATLKADSLIAMQKITDKDIELSVRNNDGTVYQISAEEVSFTYERADSLRYHDKSVTVTYMGVTQALPIKVERATYDMSSAVWVGTSFVYDGSEKFAYLEGLPEGVEVAAYVVNSAILAGSYKLEVRLIYDRENYNAPELADAWLNINKAVVTLPQLNALVYNKNLQSPKVPESELYRATAVPQLSAGIYRVYFELTDADNYKFENGIDYVEYEILPRAVTVKIISGGNKYSVEEGRIIEGDDLMLKYYTEDGYIIARSENPDYIVKVIPLKAEGERVWLILLFILLIILVLLLVYILVRHRESLEAFFVGFKARLAGVAPDEANAAVTYGEPALEGIMRSVDEVHANELITDALAKTLLSKSTEVIKTTGTKRAIINVEALSGAFSEGDSVDINSMKEKGLISRDAVYVKVLGGGIIDKPLSVKANAFSLSAVKMIALTGGNSQRVRSIKNKDTDFGKELEN